jgi:hypothetical protein
MPMREEMDRLFNQFFGRGDGEEATWGRRDLGTAGRYL